MFSDVNEHVVFLPGYEHCLPSFPTLTVLSSSLAIPSRNFLPSPIFAPCVPHSSSTPCRACLFLMSLSRSSSDVCAYRTRACLPSHQADAACTSCTSMLCQRERCTCTALISVAVLRTGTTNKASLWSAQHRPLGFQTASCQSFFRQGSFFIALFVIVVRCDIPSCIQPDGAVFTLHLPLLTPTAARPVWHARE